MIDGNVITRGLDVLLWYSERVTVIDNEISSGRYGLDFMHCDDAHIANNRLQDNSVGVFMMYSRRVQIEHNTIVSNRGPSGYGVGSKDMDDTVLIENLLLDNRIGVHLDTSPREIDSIGHFIGNVFTYNDIGVNMMPSVRHNEFASNSFIDNQQQVAAGGGQLMVDAPTSELEARLGWQTTLYLTLEASVIPLTVELLTGQGIPVYRNGRGLRVQVAPGEKGQLLHFL